MSKYASKLPNEVTEFMPLIVKSRQDARRLEFTPPMAKLSENALAYPSVATDHAESKRISQFFLNKVLNKASGLEEVSSHQHAAALKGQKSSFTTENFANANLNVGDAANHFLSVVSSSSAGGGTLERSSSSEDRDSDHCSSGGESDTDGEEDLERHGDDGVVDESTQRKTASPDSTNKQHSNPRLLFVIPGEFVLSYWLDDYLYRPVHLYGHDYDEFTAIFDRRKKKNSTVGAD